MVVHDEKRFAFLAIPKNASCSLQRPPDGVLLSPAFGGRHVGDPHHDAHRMDAPPGYFTFAVVRDPLSRIESMWRHYSAQFPDRPESRSFDAFVRATVAGDLGGFHESFAWNQATWLALCPNPVHLLRLSHLQADLEALGLHDAPFRVPRLNARPRAPIAWTDTLHALATAWGRDDPRG